jgi:hypothetical protein
MNPGSSSLELFLSGFLGALFCRSGAGSVPFVAFTGLGFGLGMLPPISGQGSADIDGFNEGPAKFVAADIPFIGARIDQLALRHAGLQRRLGRQTSRRRFRYW